MGVESEVKWRKCFGSSSTHRKISAVESAVEMFVPNFRPFILPAVLAQLHLDVPQRLFSNVRFVQVFRGFSSYFLLLLPLILLNDNLPYPTYMHIYMCICPYVQRQCSHSCVLVSR